MGIEIQSTHTYILHLRSIYTRNLYPHSTPAGEREGTKLRLCVEEKGSGVTINAPPRGIGVEMRDLITYTGARHILAATYFRQRLHR